MGEQCHHDNERLEDSPTTPAPTPTFGTFGRTTSVGVRAIVTTVVIGTTTPGTDETREGCRVERVRRLSGWNEFQRIT